MKKETVRRWKGKGRKRVSTSRIKALYFSNSGLSVAQEHKIILIPCHPLSAAAALVIADLFSRTLLIGWPLNKLHFGSAGFGLPHHPQFEYVL